MSTVFKKSEWALGDGNGYDVDHEVHGTGMCLCTYLIMRVVSNILRFYRRMV